MKLVMLKLYGFFEDDEDTVSAVGLYPDSTEDSLILDEVYAKYGYICTYNSTTDARTVNGVEYGMRGSVDIHCNIEASGQFKSSLSAY